MSRREVRRRFLHAATAMFAAAPVGLLWAQRKPACTATNCATDCGPTGAATEGPFYVRNVAVATDINTRAARGKPMRVSGVVLGGADGSTPLAGVKVEIWHCDAGGDYHPNGNGDVSRYRPADINLRGIGTTDAQGRFAFDSIVPANYGSRRRHIHWRFEATGHKAVTTQSYWLNEKGSARDLGDFTDRNAEACRWLEFTTNARGVEEGFFEVKLARA